MPDIQLTLNDGSTLSTSYSLGLTNGDPSIVSIAENGNDVDFVTGTGTVTVPKDTFASVLQSVVAHPTISNSLLFTFTGGDTLVVSRTVFAP